MAIAQRGPVAPASSPHKAVIAAMTALLEIDQADRVRAIRFLSI